MGLFKSKAQEEWKVNYIREFNEEILNSLLSTNMIKKASINNITKNMLSSFTLLVKLAKC